MSDTKSTIGNNMLLVTTIWNEHPSFKLIPATIECPYIEALYDRTQGVLAVISKIPKEILQMLPRLDEAGEMVASKKAKRNGKGYQEQRVTLNTVQEYYIDNFQEIESFIQRFAINASDVDYKSLLEVIKPKTNTILQKEELDENVKSKLIIT